MASQLWVIYDKEQFRQAVESLPSASLSIVVLDMDHARECIDSQTSGSQLSVTILDGIEWLTREADTAASRARQQIQSWLQHIPHFWACRFAEMNYSDPVWMAWLHAEVIAAACQQHNIQGIRMLGEPYEVHQAVRNRCPAQSIQAPYWTRERCWYRSIRRVLGMMTIAIRNLITLFRAAFRRPAPPDNLDAHTLVFTHYPANWLPHQPPAYRFTGGIQPETRNQTGVGFVCSALRTQKASLRPSSSLQSDDIQALRKRQVLLLEDWIRPADVLVAAMMALRNGLSPWRTFLNRWQQKGVDACTVIRHFSWIDDPKRRIYGRAVRRMLRQFPEVRQALVPVFELSEGRMDVAASRAAGIRTIGLQHGTGGLLNAWRFLHAQVVLQANASPASPDRILLEGELPQAKLNQAGCQKTTIVGAPRLRDLPPAPAEVDHVDDSVFLVLLDMHRWRVLFDWILQTAGTRDEIRFVVRAHPSQAADVQRALPHGTDRVELDRSPSLNDALATHRPRAILAGETGSVIELALRQWPVWLMETSAAPVYNPLAYDCPSVTILPPLHNSLETILHQSASPRREHYAEQLAECAARHVSAWGDEADRNLLRFLQSWPATPS